jgi:hypothetical protein
MIRTLIWHFLPIGNAALAKGRAMSNAVSALQERVIGHSADASLEVVCLFSLLGLTLTLAFSRLVAG